MKLRYVYGLVAAAIGFVSCTTATIDERPVLKIASVAQEAFLPDSPSRASYEGYSTKFEEGDQLGLILIDRQGAQTANAPFTYRGGQWTNDNMLSYSSKIARAIAYYPYKANLAGSVTSAEALKQGVEIKSDQSSLDEFKEMDLLVCEIDQIDVSLDIVFHHAFSMINLSAKSALIIGDETFGYNLEMADVALAIDDANYVACNLNGTYACLVKDGSLLETDKFRYFYTISGQTSAKTVKTAITTTAGTQYTFPCTAPGSSAEASVAIGDFYCVSASGKVVIVPGSAAALPEGLTCNGVVFHVLDNAAFSAFAATNGLDASALPGYDQKHGLVVSAKKGEKFGSATGAALTEVLSTVADYRELTVANGYMLTQTLQNAINAGSTTITFTALNNHKADQAAGATAWYAPSFYELTCLARGNDTTVGSVKGIEQINKQLAKLANGYQIIGNLPSLTTNSDGLCIMEKGSEMGWHGVPDESFYIICAF